MMDNIEEIDIQIFKQEGQRIERIGYRIKNEIRY